ncbi:MAG TPA: hypothetical protein VKS79_19545 [Gemmataceae bacterium]|nr:hypothetical protein [Gemmataceae bacterium]
MDRILRISPILLISFGIFSTPTDSSAKPPELPATANDQCVIPAAFRPFSAPFDLQTLEFRIEVPQSDVVRIPAEIEVLTVPPRETPSIPYALRTPDLPAIDSRLILTLEKIEQEVESYRAINRDVPRIAIRGLR